jgi:hypothetical protein
MLYSYRAYGLALHSTLPLPELPQVDDCLAADVLVRLGRVERRPPTVDFTEGYVCGTPEDAYIFVEDVGSFRVLGGREIVVDRAPGAADSALRIFILGGAFGLLLQQRGLMTLHASAVVGRMGAIAFLGESGAGKSTMAAAMHKRGYSILADDVTALEIGKAEVPLVLPAFPRLKIWPRVAATLKYDRETLSVFHPEDERRDYCDAQGFADAPIPLRLIYVLLDEENQGFERLAPQDAFAELLGNSYAAGLLGQAGATPTHLRQCAILGSQVAVYYFKRPLVLTELRDLAELLDNHIEETTERDLAAA